MELLSKPAAFTAVLDKIEEAFHIPVNGRVFNNSVSGATSNY